MLEFDQFLAVSAYVNYTTAGVQALADRLNEQHQDDRAYVRAAYPPVRPPDTRTSPLTPASP